MLPVSPLRQGRSGRRSQNTSDKEREVSSRMSRAVGKVSCEECFFKRNGLCALREDEACPTFRPDDPEGLKPPRQMRFVFRQERRTRSAFAFPTAQERVALHA
jgi:hypothetical protein